MIDIEQARKVCDAATPGPWTWYWPASTAAPRLICPKHGLLTIADAVRDGMQGAAIRFAERTRMDKGGVMRHVGESCPRPGPRDSEIVESRNPDAAFIAAARTGWPDALDALEAERKELLATTEALKDMCDAIRRENAEVERLRAALAQTTVDVENLPTFSFKAKVRAALSPNGG